MISLLLLMIVVVLFSALAVVLQVVAIAFPNPLRRGLYRTTPEELGLPAHRVVLPDGCPGWFIPNPAARRLVVVCHGRSRNKSWMLPLAAPLAARWNVLVFDFPSHGENPFGRTTIGYNESRTVDAALHWAAEAGHRDVVLVGTSMGGVAAMIALGRQTPPVASGLVTIGSFDALERVIDGVRRRVLMPPVIKYVVFAICRAITGVDPRLVRPVQTVDRIGVPARFLHGDGDWFVPAEAAAHLELAAGGRGKALYYPGGHDEPHNPALQQLVVETVQSFPERT